ncbi:MAG: hypothetical protein ACLR8P_11660 [Clostridium fessum]
MTPQDMDERICKLSAAIAEGSGGQWNGWRKKDNTEKNARLKNRTKQETTLC